MLFLLPLLALLWAGWNWLERNKENPSSVEKDLPPARIVQGTGQVDASMVSSDSDAEDWRKWLANWAAKAPRKALDWIQEQCPEDDRSEAISILITAWVSQAPSDAADAVTTIRDSSLREHFVKELTRTWVLRAPKDAALWISSLSDYLGMYAMEALRSHVSEIPFTIGIALAESLNKKMKEGWIPTFVEHWHESQTKSLIDWALRTDAQTQRFVLIATLPRFAQKNPRAAANYADGLGTVVPFAARRRIALNWAKTDPNSALEWVSKLKTDPQKGIATRAVLSVVAESAPLAAADAALQITDEKLQLEACLDVMGIWAKQDPVKAANWASSFPAGKAYAKAIDVVAREYVRRDWRATGEWLKSLNPGPELDPVIGEYVQDIQSMSPLDAVTWAQGIKNETERTRRLKSALQVWTTIDPAAAAEWKAQNGL